MASVLLVMDEGPTRALVASLCAASGRDAAPAADPVAFAEAFARGGFTHAVVAFNPAFGRGAELAAALRRRFPAIELFGVGEATAEAVRALLACGARDLFPPTVEGLASLAAQLGTAPAAAEVPADPRLPARVAELEAELAALRMAAAPSDRALAELAHDLREPLRTGRHLLERLSRQLGDGDPGDAPGLVARLYDQAARLEDLVNGVLDDAAGRVTDAAAARSDADRVLDEVAAELAALLAETGGTLTREPLPEIGLPPHQLRQVLQNLVANALRHGGRPPAVHVSAAADGEDWTLSVRDNGAGIPPEAREAIFRPFARIQHDGMPTGHGLGLAICRKVVERVGGRIWAEAAPGGGSIFRVRIPGAAALEPTESLRVARAGDRRGG